MTTDRPTREQLIAHGLSPLWRPYHADERHGLHLPGDLHTAHVFGQGQDWTIEIRHGELVERTHQMQSPEPVPFDVLRYAEGLLELADDPGMPEEFDHGWKHS